MKKINAPYLTKKINQLNLPNDRIIFITNNLLAEKFHDNLNIDNKINKKESNTNIIPKIPNSSPMTAKIISVCRSGSREYF